MTIQKNAEFSIGDEKFIFEDCTRKGDSIKILAKAVPQADSE